MSESCSALIHSIGSSRTTRGRKAEPQFIASQTDRRFRLPALHIRDEIALPSLDQALLRFIYRPSAEICSELSRRLAKFSGRRNLTEFFWRVEMVTTGTPRHPCVFAAGIEDQDAFRSGAKFPPFRAILLSNLHRDQRPSSNELLFKALLLGDSIGWQKGKPE